MMSRPGNLTAADHTCGQTSQTCQPERKFLLRPANFPDCPTATHNIYIGGDTATHNIYIGGDTATHNIYIGGDTATHNIYIGGGGGDIEACRCGVSLHCRVVIL